MAKRAFKRTPSDEVDAKGCSYLRRRVIGQRPSLVRWTPSRSLPWWFGSFAEGRRFTFEQDRTLEALGLRTDEVEAMEVRREVPQSPDEPVMLVPDQWPPVYQFLCPVVGPGRKFGVRIVTPSGSQKDVREDGWAHEPSTRPFQMGGLGAW